MKTCKKCGYVGPDENFHGFQCKQCRLKYRREWAKRSKEWLRNYRQTNSRERDIERATKWNKENIEKHREHSLSYYYRLQDQAIMAYGGYTCACCGETERLFLTLDHINNDGSAFRKSHNFLHHGARFYKWLKANGYPPGYQVLCSNCNHGKHRNNGVCPHQRA